MTLEQANWDNQSKSESEEQKPSLTSSKKNINLKDSKIKEGFATPIPMSNIKVIPPFIPIISQKLISKKDSKKSGNQSESPRSSPDPFFPDPFQKLK